MKKQPRNPKALQGLVPDPRNANHHTRKGMERLQESIKNNGAGRSILISNDNVIIAGNGVTEASQAVGINDLQIVDSDGSKVIAIRRTDIKSGTKEFHRLALADNIVAKENINLDSATVAEICTEFHITEYLPIREADPNDGLPKLEGENAIKTLFFTFPIAQYNRVKAKLDAASDNKETALLHLLGIK